MRRNLFWPVKINTCFPYPHHLIVLCQGGQPIAIKRLITHMTWMLSHCHVYWIIGILMRNHHCSLAGIFRRSDNNQAHVFGMGSLNRFAIGISKHLKIKMTVRVNYPHNKETAFKESRIDGGKMGSSIPVKANISFIIKLLSIWPNKNGLVTMRITTGNPIPIPKM